MIEDRDSHFMNDIYFNVLYEVSLHEHVVFQNSPNFNFQIRQVFWSRTNFTLQWQVGAFKSSPNTNHVSSIVVWIYIHVNVAQFIPDMVTGLISAKDICTLLLTVCRGFTICRAPRKLIGCEDNKFCPLGLTIWRNIFSFKESQPPLKPSCKFPHYQFV